MSVMRLLVVFSVLVLSGCSYVEPGHVGIKVDMLGSEKGVDSEELGVGRYWIGVNEVLYTFPTFTQNYVWTKDVHENSGDDESITFQSMEGLSVNADIGISYHINPDKVSNIFEKYRKGVDEITDIYLRNMVRDSLVTSSSLMTVEEIYGKGKSSLIAEVQDRVATSVKGIGIEIEKIYWIGDLRLPASVMKAINAKIAATQKAQQRENEVQQTKAEAEKAREEAKGKADAILLVAKAEAKAINIKAAALKRNPDVIKLEAINKWDGVLPRVSGQSAQLIDVTGMIE